MIQNIPVQPWNVLAAQAPWSAALASRTAALLLGNGGSIALHPAFQYSSLYSVASAAPPAGWPAPVFAHLGTTDFELVLRVLWHAELVTNALGTPSPAISNAYSGVRAALIAAVNAVHPAHGMVAPQLPIVGGWCQQFAKIVSLNYDVMLYWAMLHQNSQVGNWYKDAFVEAGPLGTKAFRFNWSSLLPPYPPPVSGTTMVFYPHGNLALARNVLGIDCKVVTNAGPSLLGQVSATWNGGSLSPLFVSEGTSVHKLAAIHQSHYLSSVYNSVLVAGLSNLVVVYGFSFGPQDDHIVAAMSVSPPSRLAVSVFTGQPAADQQAYCHHVLARITPLMPAATVDFFDSMSAGCWNNP